MIALQASEEDVVSRLTAGPRQRAQARVYAFHTARLARVISERSDLKMVRTAACIEGPHSAPRASPRQCPRMSAATAADADSKWPPTPALA